MASSAKDIQLRELKDTVSQLKTMISEQTELIKSLRLIIDKKSSHEKALQEQVDYLTKKLFGSSSERRSDDIPGQQNLFDEAEVEQDPSLLERPCLGFCRCMDHVSEVCQWASPLPAGERLETVWCPDQPHHSCQLDHLLFAELFSANV